MSKCLHNAQILLLLLLVFCCLAGHWLPSLRHITNICLQLVSLLFHIPRMCCSSTVVSFSLSYISQSSCLLECLAITHHVGEHALAKCTNIARILCRTSICHSEVIPICTSSTGCANEKQSIRKTQHFHKWEQNSGHICSGFGYNIWFVVRIRTAWTKKYIFSNQTSNWTVSLMQKQTANAPDEMNMPEDYHVWGAMPECYRKYVPKPTIIVCCTMVARWLSG